MHSKKIIILIGIIIILMVCIFAGLHVLRFYKQPIPEKFQPHVVINNKTIILEEATTTAEQIQGLSDRDGLPTDHAMLFVFNHPDTWGIWMKDMKFNLDILWLDENYTVVSIQENVSPDSYPESFTPTNPASYVVEANVGFVEANNIKIGTHLDVTK